MSLKPNTYGAVTRFNQPLESRRPLCAHCGKFESFGKDGLCVRCRRVVKNLLGRA